MFVLLGYLLDFDRDRNILDSDRLPDLYPQLAS